MGAGHAGALQISSLFATCLLIIALTGCTPHQQPTPPPAAPTRAAPVDPWLITTTSIDASYRPTYLGNGELGQMMDAGGLGMTGGSAVSAALPAAASGTAQHLLPGPQPASLAGLYDRGKMVPLPPLFPFAVEMNGKPFGADLATLSGYSQTLDLQHAILTTKATWNGAPVEIAAFVSRADPFASVCRVVAPGIVRVQPVFAPKLPGIQQNSGLIPPDSAAPAGLIITTLASTTTTSAGRSATIPRGQASTHDQQKRVDDFTDRLKRHQAAWDKLWASDIEIEGNPADQQLVHALIYQLLSSVREDVSPAPGFPPMGLSNPAAFDGHVFWDADTWIFPALLPLHPNLARTILDYRLRTFPGAKANAAAEKLPGASYAWESAEDGREVATLATRHGRHVTADVAMANWNYYLATGDRDWLRERGWPVLSATADYWTGRAVKNAQGQYQIRRVSTPDENAGLVDNSAWTNFGARQNLRIAARAARLLGLPANPRWSEVANGLLNPHDASGMILEYSGYQGRPAKQADTLLLLFPGEMPLPRAEQERMFHYYVDRTIKSGPAMTDSVHAVIAARLGQPEEAYRRFRASVDPFVRPPFYSFSEKRTRDHLNFLTGASGSLQAVLYGFAGLRLQDSAKPVFQPQLPPAWSGLTLRNFQWRGKRYDVVIKRGQAAQLRPR